MKTAAARAVLFLCAVYFLAGLLFGTLAGQAASNQVRVGWRWAGPPPSRSRFAGALVAFLVRRGLMAGGTIPAPILVGVPVLLLAVSAFSCWVPARRAARIDALAALRWE
jgi:ABC-type antimicrobial peptide transport system permease subunit